MLLRGRLNLSYERLRLRTEARACGAHLHKQVIHFYRLIIAGDPCRLWEFKSSQVWSVGFLLTGDQGTDRGAVALQTR